MSNGIEKISWKQNGMHLTEVFVDVTFASQKEIKFLIPKDLVNHIFQIRDSEIEMHLKFNESDHPEVYPVDFSDLKPLEFRHSASQENGELPKTEDNAPGSGEKKNGKAGVFSIFHPASNRWLTAQGWGYVQNYFDIVPEKVMESSLSVSIAPQEAVDSGAKWRVKELEWQPSDSSVSVAGGIYEVEFSNLQGWNTPQPQQVYVIDGVDEKVSAKYAKSWWALLDREPFNVISVFLVLFILFLGFYFFDSTDSQSTKVVSNPENTLSAENSLPASPEKTDAMLETDPVASETAKAEPAPSEAVEAEPAPSETAAVEPVSSETAAVESVSSETAAIEPAPSETAAAEPAPSETAAAEPAPSETAAAEPVSSETAAADPASSEPAAADPASSETAVAEPAPSEPAAAELASSETSAADPAPFETAAAEPALSETAAVESASSETAAVEPVSSKTAAAEPAASETVEADAVRPETEKAYPVPSEAVEAAPAAAVTTDVENDGAGRSITVRISPSEAARAGARWKVQGPGGWKKSGEKISGLINIAYTVIFKSVAGWETPHGILLSDTEQKQLLTEGTYKKVMGHVQADKP